MRITATLKDARPTPWYKTVIGFIYGDMEGRWRDGTPIYTSTPRYLTPDNILITLNSVYKIEWAPGCESDVERLRTHLTTLDE